MAAEEAVDVHELEARDGLRFSWNVWPTSRLEAQRCIVPFGCVYSPHAQLAELHVLPYEPVFCKTCRTVLSPYCQVDFQSKLWVCPFCQTRNHFPHEYAVNISPENLPAELYPGVTTVEYNLPRKPIGPPVYLFLVDTCITEDELASLRDTLVQTINTLPEESLVGLVTYGANVQVYEIAFSECTKSYVFRGSKGYSAAQVAASLSLFSSHSRAQPAVAAAPPRPGMPQQQQTPQVAAQQPTGADRFLQPVADCAFTLTSILEELTPDPWPARNGERRRRCTGAAMSVSIGLLESLFPNRGARIVSFIGGPCTEGPGVVAAKELKEPIRSHNDLQKDLPNARFSKPASEFYRSLAQQCVKNGHTVDLFACALDQVGLHEMRAFIDRTGGCCVMTDTYTEPNGVFQTSLPKFFARKEASEGAEEENAEDADSVDMAFCSTVEVHCSREFKVAGCIGPCISMKKKTNYVAETEIGEGGTSAWRMCTMRSSTSLAFYFEVVNQHANPIAPGQMRHIQFLTQYQHPSGGYRLRVTTYCGSWADASTNMALISSGFDQECAAVLMARVAAYKTESDDCFDIIRWLDRMLIRLVAKFADRSNANGSADGSAMGTGSQGKSSLSLGYNFSIYPQFMFHLRRSRFLQIFGFSPDETSFFRSSLLHANVTDTLIMIQPTLLAYTFTGPPEPVLLDVTSVAPDRILLLDTYFNLVIFHGDTVAQWRKQGYQDHPEHQHFRDLLLAPKEDARAILDERFPVPKYIECDQYGSQARFLLAVLNPSVTHNTNVNAATQGTDFIQTDDVSFQVFMDHLTKLAAKSSE